MPRVYWIMFIFAPNNHYVKLQDFSGLECFTSFIYDNKKGHLK